MDDNKLFVVAPGSEFQAVSTIFWSQPNSTYYSRAMGAHQIIKIERVENGILANNTGTCYENTRMVLYKKGVKMTGGVHTR
jgi:hypothetical protein